MPIDKPSFVAVRCWPQAGPAYHATGYLPPFNMSQTRALLSVLPETRNVPSAENASEVMRCVCPSRTAAFSHFVVSHTSIQVLLLGSPDSLPTASSLPSGEKASALLPNCAGPSAGPLTTLAVARSL